MKRPPRHGFRDRKMWLRESNGLVRAHAGIVVPAPGLLTHYLPVFVKLGLAGASDAWSHIRSELCPRLSRDPPRALNSG